MLGEVVGAEQVGQERRCRRRVRDAVPLDQLDEPLRVPHLLVDPGRAELDRQPRAVEQPGQVRERGGHVQHAAGIDLHPLRHRPVRGPQRVVRVHDALGLAGSSRGEDQQRDLVRGRAQPGHFFRRVLLFPRGRQEFLERRPPRPGRPADDQQVFQVRQVRADPLDHPDVIEPAELLRDDEHARSRQPQPGADFAVPEDRDQRIADRADAGAREVRHQPLDAVGQLEGHHVAGIDAQLQQPGRAALHQVGQLAVGDGAVLVHRRDLVRHASGRRVEVVRDDLAGPVALRDVLRDALAGEVGFERHGRAPFQLVVAAAAHGGPSGGAVGSRRPVRCARRHGASSRPSLSRAITSFMICAVPSPICRPSTSRSRCSSGRSVR